MSRDALNQNYIACYTRGARTPPCTGFLLQENGFRLLQENGFGILIDVVCPGGALLQENDGFLLQENGFKILQES
jgi:hypothetical protein